MGRKSGFTAAEVEQIRKLYVDAGRTHSQIAKIIGKGSEERTKLETFRPGQVFGAISLIKRLQKSKKLRYHVACSCGYEFDMDPYLLTLPDNHPKSIRSCPRCSTSQAKGKQAESGPTNRSNESPEDRAVRS